MRGKIFNSISLSKPKSNVFDLSHERKLSTKFGVLTPILLEEIVPGDSFRVKTEHMLRLPPMLAPVMHRINVFVHYFFVPTRIIWDNYESFFTGGKDGKSFPVFPVVQITEQTKQKFGKGSLADYFGIPPVNGTVNTTQSINALPFRAYTKIYNDYYRDQNLIDEIQFETGDNNNTTWSDIITIRNRAFEKDYFTSSLPDTQRGDDVMIPTTINYRDPAKAFMGDGTTPQGDGPLTVGSGNGTITGANGGAIIDNIEGFSSTINDLRTSVRLQEFLERSMRGGARYVEHVLSFFGVHSKDSRQMRPEYLGGSKAPVVISEVLSTFDNTETAGGTMYGHGISAGSQAGFKRYFSEHGYVIGIMSVLPRTAYQQGIEKMWLKKDRYEFFYPQFANLGEQPVLSKELYVDYAAITSDNESVFGYTPRYAEYKYRNSFVAGDFRDTLDFWHLGRKFTSRPVLNDTFVTAYPAAFNRIFADTTDTDKLYIQLYNDVKAIRPMPIYGTPRL